MKKVIVTVMIIAVVSLAFSGCGGGDLSDYLSTTGNAVGAASDGTSAGPFNQSALITEDEIIKRFEDALLTGKTDDIRETMIPDIAEFNKTMRGHYEKGDVRFFTCSSNECSDESEIEELFAREAVDLNEYEDSDIQLFYEEEMDLDILNESQNKRFNAGNYYERIKESLFKELEIINGEAQKIYKKYGKSVTVTNVKTLCIDELDGDYCIGSYSLDVLVTTEGCVLASFRWEGH